MPKDFHNQHSHLKYVGKTRKMRNINDEPEFVNYRVVERKHRNNIGGKLAIGTSALFALATIGGGTVYHLGHQNKGEVKINNDPQKQQPSEQQFYQLRDGTKVQISPRSHRPLCGDPFVKQLSSEQQKELIEKFPAMDGDADGHCG